MQFRLENAYLNGAPGWQLDGAPYIAFLAQAGRSDGAEPAEGASFYSAGCRVYTTWECGPQMSLVWQEDGTYDWSEADAYLNRIAAHDPDGRIQFRFMFDAPPWWAQKNPDEMVHVRYHGREGEQTPVVSLASELFWAEAEKAARALVHYCADHREGWRFAGVMYHGGGCEWFPSWGHHQYGDYSPAFLKAFRAWLGQRYSSDAELQVAWQQEGVTLASADLPSLKDRDRGDFHAFYDPALGLQRQDFCTYYGETATRLIERLARAFKEESDGRVFTRTPAGYQPMFEGFRHHAGPHADFATVLECQWLDSFFMPHDYRNRGHGGHHAFEIPLASVLLHNKTYIAEIDDRTHHTDPPEYGSTENAWQTAQVLKRGVGAALCQAAGVEFKDWGRGWYEDEPTMEVIRRLNNLAQASAQHDRSQIADIAVIVNPRATCHVHDRSPIYSSVNNHQALLSYPRIGAPIDRLMIDDLDRARDYKLYIIQDAFHLTEAQRALIREKVCTAGHTVLWIYAPGIVGEQGISVEGMGALMDIQVETFENGESFNYRPFLRLIDAAHPYSAGVAAGTPMFSFEKLTTIFRITDSDADILGLGGYYFDVLRPVFGVKKMDDWTSVYCSVPVLPPVIMRNIAREAGVHIYSEADDFIAANNRLLTISASIAGPRTIRLPALAQITDAMDGTVITPAGDTLSLDMQFGETRILEMKPAKA